MDLYIYIQMIQYTTGPILPKKMVNKMDPYHKEFQVKKKAFGIQLILPPMDHPLGLLMTKASVLGIVAGLENWPATAATKLGVCRVEPDSHGLQRI